jgi:hypothetical protein
MKYISCINIVKVTTQESSFGGADKMLGEGMVLSTELYKAVLRPIQTRTQVNTSLNLRLAQISSQVEMTCYKLAHAWDSFECHKSKLPQVNLHWLVFSFEQGFRD